MLLLEMPFETEEILRARGTAKTPDILLSCPVGVKVKKRNIEDNVKMHEAVAENDHEHEWKMICWIDSKVSHIIHHCMSQANYRLELYSIMHAIFSCRLSMEMLKRITTASCLKSNLTFIDLDLA
jgi:hypothetical protein